MITASALARLRACPSSAVLPRTETHSPWADAGRDAHERLSVFGDDHPFAHLLPPNPRAEVKLAYDVATGEGRVIGDGAGRDYGHPAPYEIVGSCDVLGVEPDAVVVLDWKTGFRDVEAARSNAQLWFYALAACRALGFDTARVVIVYTQTGASDSYMIDSIELADFAESLEKLHRRVVDATKAKRRGELLATSEGAWCRHCPAKASCPSKAALIRQLAGQQALGEVTPATAADAYAQIVKLEMLVDDAKKRLQTYVEDNGPIALPDGRMYGRHVRPGREKLDARAVVRAAREIVEDYEAFEGVAFERKTSKAAIKRAAEALGDKSLEKRVLKRVKDLGGIEKRDEIATGEFDPAKHKPVLSTTANDNEIEEANRLLAASE